MKALVYTATETLELHDLPEPDPAPESGRVVVAVSHCGICGSDMHAWHGHDPRRVPPLVLGHEAVGTALSGRFAGRRVAINPLETCGACAACRAGRPHLCPDRALIGLRVPGAFAERVAIAERNLVELPEALDPADAALAEPLACAVHAVRLGIDRLAVEPARARAAVLGGGAIGLLGALVMRVHGIADVSVAERAPRRRGMVADATGLPAYDPVAGGPEPGSVDLVLDAVGTGATRAAASALAAPGGTIVHIGLQDSAEGLDTRRLTLQEIGFVGTYCYTPDDFAEAVGLLGAGRIAGAGWAERRPLAAGPAAFRDIDGGGAPPKIILEP